RTALAARSRASPVMPT
ncbi:host specificity protein J, partial [Escherichia coli PA34]